MISDKLAIVLYTSTRGHFGYKDCYKHTVKRMAEEIPMFDDYYKVAHIKVSPEDDEDVLVDIEAFLGNSGFNVISSRGDWKHNDTSHHNEYYKDMLTALSDIRLHKYPYVLVCEDDWLLKFSGGYSKYVTEALSFLDNDLSALCIRINHDVHKNEDIRKGLKTNLDSILKQGPNFTEFGPTFTFQPTIVRLKEWWHSVRIINQQIKRNPLLLNMIHCEMISGETMKQFSDSPLPFCFFNPEFINADHIGEKEKIERMRVE